LAVRLVLLAALLTAACGDRGMEPTPHGQVVEVTDRESAPAFSGQLLDGGSFDSESVAGHVVVLNFWGSWCGPCRVEVPELELLGEDLPDDRAVIVGVNVRDQERLAQAFLADEGVTYPSLFDPDGEVAVAFAGFPVNTTPATVLIDHEGRVAAVYLGAVRSDLLSQAVDRLLDEGT
jgi:thiol-disulfide isomerase/thioredoxin